MPSPPDADALDYRPVPDDAVAFGRVLSYSFNPTEPFDPDEASEDGPLDLAAPWALYDGADPVSTVGHYWFDLRIRGAWHPVAGVAAVATPPAYRRQGYVRRLLAESLAEYRERDCVFAALWPFSHPFYGRLGWRAFSRTARTTFEPGAASFVDADDGRFVDVAPDEWARLDDVYGDGLSRPFAMDRTEDWWRERVFSGYDADPYVTGWEREGRVDGYLVYVVEDGDDGRVMTVRELGYRDPAALEQCLRYCRHHDSQVSTVRLHGPPWEARRLQERAPDPRAFETELALEPMIRLVDVRSLPALATGSESLVVDVSDPLVDWNDGRFRLSAEDCAPTDAPADASVGIGTLSTIAAGAVPVPRARWVGDLTADADACAALAELFPGTDTPYFHERF
jgi:predicted acetyltransferase